MKKKSAKPQVNFTMEELAKAIAEQMYKKQLENQSKATIETSKETLCNKRVVADIQYAPNSKYYGKKMVDGHIFNPYLHRRFIQAQYIRMMKKYDGNTSKGITEEYGYMYSIRYTLQEVNKLAMLEKRDRIAFDERSKFFTLDTVKRILHTYIYDCKKYAMNIPFRKISGIPMAVSKKVNGNEYVGTTVKTIVNDRIETKVECEKFDYLMREFDLLLDEIDSATSYNRISTLMGAFDNKYKLSNKTKKSKAFVEAFKKSGAYYTLKNLIMFDGLNIKSNSTEMDDLSYIRYLLDNDTEGYVFHAILKQEFDYSK